VYYNCVKFHTNPISNLVRVVLTRYMPPFSWKHRLNYLPFLNFGQQPYSFMHICR
jgi:hypothetical protein